MATTVYTTQDVQLLDDSTVLLKPLSIKSLRVFMKKMDEFGTAKSEDEGLEVLLDAAALCLRVERPNFWDEDKKDSEGNKVGGYADTFEDIMDMETIYKVLEVCGGVKLNDPNLLRAAAEALGQTST